MFVKKKKSWKLLLLSIQVTQLSAFPTPTFIYTGRIINRKRRECNRGRHFGSVLIRTALSTCGSVALFPPDTGGGLTAAAGSAVAAAIWPSPPSMLTWSADQRSSCDCIPQLTGRREAAVYATWTCADQHLGHITHHLSWTLLTRGMGGGGTFNIRIGSIMTTLHRLLCSGLVCADFSDVVHTFRCRS